MTRHITKLSLTAMLIASLASIAPLTAQQPAPATPPGSPVYGPARGTLIIVGGGNLDGTGIVEKFIELAGGPGKKFIIVPTAGGNRGRDGAITPYDETAVTASWIKRGVKNVKMLHTHGSHPGLSDEDHSTFRLHLVLVSARTFLRASALMGCPSKHDDLWSKSSAAEQAAQPGLHSARQRRHEQRTGIEFRRGVHLLKPCWSMWFSKRHTYSEARSHLRVHDALV